MTRFSRALQPSKLAATLGAVLAAGLIGVSSAAAVTVPNQYQCSRWTGRCLQVNGRHVNGLPNACYWTWSYYSSGSTTAVCSDWYWFPLGLAM